jgi:hypothetical protein
VTITRPADGQNAPVPGFRHEFHDTGGVTIHAVVGGEGPAVVLIHGWPFT